MIFKKIQWIFISLYIKLIVPKAYKMPTEDRFFLESKLFKEITLNYDNSKILFVGVHKYSSWYATIFNNFTSNTFFTIDTEFDYSKNKYGTSFHSVGDFLTHNFNRRFDIIIFNGIFSYGINEVNLQKKAILKIHKLLSNDSSYFIFGYRDHIDLKEEVNNLIKNKFRKVTFKNIESDLIVNSDNNHKFSFWRLN